MYVWKSRIVVVFSPLLFLDKMSVGFVYTFGVTDLTEKESFYLAVPSDDTSLKFEFDIDNNPHNREVLVQLFLGKGESSLSLFSLTLSLSSCSSFYWCSLLSLPLCLLFPPSLLPPLFLPSFIQ